MRRRHTWALSLFLWQAYGVASQVVYPTAPLRVIVPHAAGGAADALARGLAPRLAEVLRQPVVIDNKPGASGIIGAVACARAPADGHTLCLTNSDVVSLNPALYARLPYQPGRDLAPIVHLANVTGIVLANPSVKASNMKELVALAREKPDRVRWGSFGVGSIGHVYAEWLQKTAGISLLHVPYKGAGPTIPAAISGEVDVIVFSAGSSLPYIQSGKLKPLAMLGPRRLGILPDVPTMSEQGFAFHINPWVGLFAPSGTPRAVVEQLNREVNKILVDPAFVAGTLDPVTAEGAGGSVAAFERFLRADKIESDKGVGLSGIRLDAP